MKLTTADEPSAERMKVEVATPSAANAAAPITTAAASDATSLGNGVEYSTLPMRNSATVCSANTNSVDTSSAATYVDAGSGVARSRLRIAASRRTTSWIARPANAVFAQP